MSGCRKKPCRSGWSQWHKPPLRRTRLDTFQTPPGFTHQYDATPLLQQAYQVATELAQRKAPARTAPVWPQWVQTQARRQRLFIRLIELDVTPHLHEQRIARKRAAKPAILVAHTTEMHGHAVAAVQGTVVSIHPQALGQPREITPDRPQQAVMAGKRTSYLTATSHATKQRGHRSGRVQVGAPLAARYSNNRFGLRADLLRHNRHMAAHQSRLRRGRVSLPGQACHIISATHARRPVFSDPIAARRVVIAMQHMQEDGWLHAHAWVLMPDHLHWLLPWANAPACPPP